VRWEHSVVQVVVQSQPAKVGESREGGHPGPGRLVGE